jgi:predicted nucleic acid-binding protein
MVRPEYFLDTSYAIALAVPADKHHAAARTLAARLKSETARLVTTRPVLFEIGNHLSRVKYRIAGSLLIESLVADENVFLVEDTPEMFRSALEMFTNRTDKDWGLVDCLSFAVMAERHLTDALTADIHFTQAGYRALLRE